MLRWAYLVTAYIIIGLVVYFAGGKGFQPPPCCESLDTGHGGAHSNAVVNNRGWDGLLECRMIHEQADAVKPGLNEPFIDPAFGTTVLRVSDVSAEKGSSRFSHATPFNADNSYMLIQTPGSEWLLLDVPGFKTKKYVRDSSGSPLTGDVEPYWHPLDPNFLYYLRDNKFWVYDVAIGQSKVLHTFDDYIRVTGTVKGKLSREGSRIALLGFDKLSGLPSEVFIYNIREDKAGLRLKTSFAPEGISWVTVTPGGDYCIIGWGQAGFGQGQGTELYNTEMEPVRRLIDTVRPGELAYDTDNTQVYVVSGIDSAKWQNTNCILRVSIPSGQTVPVQTLECCYKVGLSGLALERKGWILVSTFRGKEQKCGRGCEDGWKLYQDEVYILKLDGTGTTRRVAHHRANYKSYEEPFITTNQDMSYVVWNSNWGGDGGHDVYIADLTREVRKQ